MELSDLLKRLRFAGLIFASILIVGILGYGYISNGRWLDSFYMTALTISTIGFHEVIDMSESPGGRVFTVFLAFTGIGVLTYFLSNLAALFIEGDIQKSRQKKALMKKIDKMEGHFIICGGGRVGRNVAEELEESGHDYVLIDHSDEVLDIVKKDLPNARLLNGDATNDTFLEEIGIKRAKGIFAAAKEDNTNLVICITARQLNPNIKIVTRLDNVDHKTKMKRAGANNIVSPNFIGGARMASEMIRPTVTNFLDDMIHTTTMSLRIEEIYVGNQFHEKKISDLHLEKYDRTLLVALRKGKKWIYKPVDSESIQSGDEIIIITTPQEREELEQKISK